MLINKIKKCKPIDFDSKLKEYLIKNNGKSTLTDKAKELFKQVTQNRDAMSKMKEIQISSEEIKNNIEIIISYINQINAIRKKMIFGKDKYCCKITFDWSDTIKGNHIKSYNIEFELFNALYNLAVLYYCNALNLARSDSPPKEIRKEITLCFRYAIYIFNFIKEEAKKKIDIKELQSDLYDEHLDYCIVMCEIEGQIQIYKIAKETNPKDYVLHSKLLLAVSELYQKACDLSNKPQNKKGEVNNMVLYFENRAKYFKAEMFRDLKNENKKIFDEKGTAYGEVQYFQTQLVNELTECNKTINKLGKFLNIESFQKEFEEAQKELKEIEDLNDRIYHQALPKEENLSYETKNMMNELKPSKLYIGVDEYKLKKDEKLMCPELDLLAPKEVREMIDRYRPKMNLFISQNLDKYENEGTIYDYIEQLKLPKKLTKKPLKEGEEDPNNCKQIPEELWERISQVQQIGGPNALNNIMQGILNKSNFLLNNLQNLLHSFEAEDKDDANCRQQFQGRWMRQPSQRLNYQMVQGAQNFISSLNQTKEFDQQENNDINNKRNLFEQLMLPREKLNENIPEEEIIQEEETPEEKEIKDEILKLYELQDKCTNIIQPIFIRLNDDSILITQLLEVLYQRTTEQIIFERNKNHFQSQFNELKNVSEEVVKQKEVINGVVQKNYEKVKPKENENNNPNPKAMNYFSNLYQISTVFLDKYDKLMKGDKYYNDLKDKIDRLIKDSNNWMIQRSNEKNNMIKNMNNMSNSQMQGGDQGFPGNPFA
jgi:hypothetical protein